MEASTSSGRRWKLSTTLVTLGVCFSVMLTSNENEKHRPQAKKKKKKKKEITSLK